jgi:hypothetical protein
MKTITDQQIEQVLRVVYATNISAQQFDALQKFLSDLPKVEEPKENKKK